MSEKIQRNISYFLQATLIIALIWSIYTFNLEVLFLTAVNLWLTFLPKIIARNFKVFIPIGYAFSLNLFVYSAIFLGSAVDLYDKIWWWDTALHTLSGVALGFIGFVTMHTLYARHRVNMGPFFLAIFSFVFAVALGALWEIFEFTADNLIGTNMQKNGLRDTMWDLIVDTLGALFIATLGYFQFQSQNKFFLKSIIESFQKLNRHLLKH